MKKTIKSCKKIVAKFNIKFESESTILLVNFTMNEDIMEPNSFEKLSDTKISGKIDFKGVTKSICWETWKIFIDCLIITGVKNQRGRIIRIKNKTQIRNADRFLDFNFFKILK